MLQEHEERDINLEAVSTQNEGRGRVNLAASSTVRLTGQKKSYIRTLLLYTGTYTRETLFTMFIRPVVLLLVPPVLWASLVEAVTIGFFVAVTSNVAIAFGETYGFETGQIGLCFLSPLICAYLAIFFGGAMSDQVANFFTARNSGVRVPEMRIPAIFIATILTPAGLILYGESIHNHLHWSAPTIALGICKELASTLSLKLVTDVAALVMFTMVQSNNVVIVYTVDSYRPVSGEVLVSQFAFKCKPNEPRVQGIVIQYKDSSALTYADLISLFRVPAKLLYESLGRQVWLPHGFWDNGRNCRRHHAVWRAIILLGAEDSCQDA